MLIKYPKQLLVLLLAFLLGCSPRFTPIATQTSHAKVESNGNSTLATNTGQMLLPYRLKMEKELNQVIGFSADTYTKSLPESGLGNWLADIMLNETILNVPVSVHGAVVNYGGIRSSLQAGDLTVGAIYEIMPFDNKIVVLELSGVEVQQLLDRFAETGGTPIAGIQFTIAQKKATQVFIQEKPLDASAKYFIALTDYLADGGDNCLFLKNKPQIPTNLLYRDAIINYCKSMNKQSNYTINCKVEGRIK